MGKPTRTSVFILVHGSKEHQLHRENDWTKFLYRIKRFGRRNNFTFQMDNEMNFRILNKEGTSSYSFHQINDIVYNFMDICTIEIKNDRTVFNGCPKREKEDKQEGSNSHKTCSKRQITRTYKWFSKVILSSGTCQLPSISNLHWVFIVLVW